MGQEKMMSSHNEMNNEAKEGDFWGQEKLILGQNMTNSGISKVTFWDRRG
jgi:hypothetical protein